MKPAINFMLLLAVAVLTMGNTSVKTNDNQESIPKDVPAINLYKEYFEYAKTVMRQGIPALNVPPLDPYFLNVTFEYQQDFVPTYGLSNVSITLTGINISDFSNFEVITADLNLDDMIAYVELYFDSLSLQFYDFVTSAVALDGTFLQYNCSTIYGDISNTNFSSLKKLELENDYLQVEYFSLNSLTNEVGTEILPPLCSGDEALAIYIGQHVTDMLSNLAFTDIPAYFKNVSDEYTVILNDILALRNVTDDDVTGIKSNADSKANLYSLIEILKSHVGQETVKRTFKQSSYQKLAEKPKDNGLSIKWNM